MKPTVYSGSNYAHIEGYKMSFYYGPDEIDEETGEWLFVARKNGKPAMLIPTSQLLEVAGGDGPKDMLLAGIALYLNR